MNQEQTQAFVKGCVRGDAPPCAVACPFGLDVKDFLAKSGKGKWTSAYKTYRNAVVFPVVVAELCPEPCKLECKLNASAQPIEQRAVERAVLANVKKRSADFYNVPQKEKRVLVVGASVGGLACALGLAQKQYRVTVADVLDGWGGSLRKHSKFAEFDADFRDQFAAVNVEFRYGNPTVDESGYDAVYRSEDRGDPIAEIVRGAADALRIETYLQTGKYPEIGSSRSYADAQQLESPALSEDAAKLEGVRCEQCDCSACLDACPMLRSFRKDPKRLALEFFTDSHVNPPLSTHSMTREAYSCTDCGACAAACPQGIDLGRLFYAYRRMRSENNTVPTAFHDVFLRRMEQFNSRGREIAPSSGSEYVFFPGCSLAQELPDTSEHVYQYLRTRYGAGLLERCCGSPIIWAGIDAERQPLNADYTYVYACPSCYETLQKLQPDVRLLSVYELLHDLTAERSEPMTLFHACSSRGNDKLRESVEALANRASLVTQRSAVACCGYGGQTQFANPKQFRETVESSAELDDKPYLVYCANCRETFLRQGKPCKHVLELLFPASNAAEPLPLVIPDNVRAYMSDNLITERDVLDTIGSPDSGRFELADGVHAASLVRGALTYWVEYREVDGAFEVVVAYYHRMKFRQEGKS